MIPIIKYKGSKIAFTADLIPSIGHLKVPYIPSYDTRPLLSMDEKSSFLRRAIKEDITLFFEHDAFNECCTLKEGDRGIKLSDKFNLSAL